MYMENGVIIQYFQHNLSKEFNIWKCIYKEAANLAELGITAMWVPMKTIEELGILDEGNYDKNYKISREFIEALSELKANMIQVYGDIQFDSNSSESDEVSDLKRAYYIYSEIDGFKIEDIDSIEKKVLIKGLLELRNESKKELFLVGEYWCKNINKILQFLKDINEDVYLFDVPLHYNLYKASKEGGLYDLQDILKGTLLEKNPMKSVTFVDNHKTQKGQIEESYIEEWFKPIAYSLILLRKEGYPCIFFGDYYGNISDNIKSMKEVLDTLLYVRMNYAYGIQHSYFDNPNIVGWTREGEERKEGSGIAVIISNMYSGRKEMYIGNQFSGKVMYDCTSNRKEEIIIDDFGIGDFLVNEKSVSVWVFK